MPAPTSRPGGRTARVTDRILAATVDLIGAGGVSAVTYEAVARASGSGRATIYRKWPDREDLVREALQRFAEASVSVPDTGDVRADVVDFLESIARTLASPAGRAIINASVVGADDDPIRRLGRDVLQARLGALQTRLDRAAATGDLPALDASFLNLMLAAPVYLLVVRDGAPLDRATAERITDTVLSGVLPR